MAQAKIESSKFKKLFVNLTDPTLRGSCGGIDLLGVRSYKDIIVGM